MEENNSQKTSQALETKNRILKAALKLFNDKGVHAVTTHDVAEAAGMSPGNLYYHYKNKQAIVRALFYQIEIFSVNAWWGNSPANREVRFADFVQFYFGALSKYRFFFREFSSLLAEDEILAREWNDNYARLFAVMEETLAGWVKQGLMKPFPSVEDSRIFIETVWIISAFSQVHFESQKNYTHKALLDERTRYLAKFLYPYHTPKGQRVIDLYL